jgi:hypothetical protein
MGITFFGVRHHGPGCARSLQAALEGLRPEMVLVEGPPDAQDMLPLLLSSEMHPPVALLIYPPDRPQRAVYYPFTSFSPEWQALSYALSRGIPARFMDLPQAIQLARGASAGGPEPAGAEAELPGLCDLLDRAILAELPQAVDFLLRCAQKQAAVSAELRHLMDALPPLARVARYGDVRKSRAEQILPVFNGLLERVLVGLAGACASLDDDAARGRFCRASANPEARLRQLSPARAPANGREGQTPGRRLSVSAARQRRGTADRASRHGAASAGAHHGGKV